MITGHVYVLTRKAGTEPFYVGWSTHSESRLAQHRHERGDLSIQMSLLEEVRGKVKSKSSGIRERYWIRCFRKLGFKLENKNNGGNGSLEHTPEVRAKIAARLRGRQVTEETKLKIAESRKLSNAVLGRKTWSQGKTKSTDPSVRAISEKLTGRKKGCFSETHRRNLSLAHKGQEVSDERRESVSKRHTGKTVSDETRARISAMASRRWQRWKALGNAGGLGKGSIDA